MSYRSRTLIVWEVVPDGDTAFEYKVIPSKAGIYVYGHPDYSGNYLDTDGKYVWKLWGGTIIRKSSCPM
jgi:hypothetical protein